MTKQQLDGAHVGAGFQQMDGEGVAERMRRDRFGNTATLMRLLACLLHGVFADIGTCNVAREQPLL